MKLKRAFLFLSVLILAGSLMGAAPVAPTVRNGSELGVHTLYPDGGTSDYFNAAWVNALVSWVEAWDIWYLGNNQVTLGNPFLSGALCDSHYMRLAPNHCIVTSSSISPVTIGTSCTLIALGTTGHIPSSAAAAWLEIGAIVMSGSAAGEIQTVTSFYTDNVCATSLPGTTGQSVAGYSGDTSSGGYVFGSLQNRLQVYNNTALNIYAFKTDNLTGCTGCTSQVIINFLGYDE